MSNRITPVLTDNALKVLTKSYLRGETPSEMFARVAKAVVKGESNRLSKNEEEALEDEFYNLMASLDFLPNSPTLMNAGRPLAQLAACFVLPIEDNMEAIGDAIKYMMLVQKSGGGTGFNFSRLRPKGTQVTSTVGEASGPLSFMKIFNEATEQVKQGGARRGANMGILRVDHPDILEFIDAKKDLTKLTNFNMSIALTETFMKAVLDNKEYDLIFNGKKYGSLVSSEVLDKIVENAWKTGEPGIVFIDEINTHNPTPELGEIEATNPCGEQPLLPFEACNLGSINLSNMVSGKEIDWSRLERVVKVAVRFLDNVIEINQYPLKQIEDMAKGNRKIGLGVMGWADMLYKLRIAYDSHEGLELAELVMRFINNTAYDASVELANTKGGYPNLNPTTKTVRNATRTTIAPTGTLSLVAAVSSGIEPLFALSYTKELTDGGKCKMLNPVFLQALKDANYSEEDSNDILAYINTHGTINNCILVSDELARVFKVASDIAPSWHVRMQAAFQNCTDNAVSKTINFNNSVTTQDIREAILNAHILKCKGLTVYRDGSRDTQPLVIGKKETMMLSNPISKESWVKQKFFKPFERPEVLPGFTTKARTGCGNMFVTVNYKDKEVKEVFLKTGNSGGCTAFTEALGRVISVGIKHGTPLDELIDQVRSVRCDNFRNQVGKDPTLKGKSCPDVVGRILKDFKDGKLVIEEPDLNYKQMLLGEWKPAEGGYISAGALAFLGMPQNELINPSPEFWLSQGLCPECHEKLQRVEGCIKCDCGFSKC